ncbi:MAG: zinc-binding dehydrogenase [Candidatus Cyclobacteriaceae bacterium M2_1C_046]
MKAVVVDSPGVVKIVEKQRPAPKEGEVLVKIKAMALNRRDQWIKEGKYPNIKYGAILGSDGAGVVEKRGEKVDESWLNKEVILMPHRNWGDKEEVQSSDYQILGMPKDGTFVEYIAVPVEFIAEKPAFLSIEEAAAIPLGGETAFRACFYHGKINELKSVLISGFGGGVAQFAFQFAIAAGAKVYVTSGDEEKRQKAIKMGAAGAFDYKNDSWERTAKAESGGFDVVIDSAGGDQVNKFINCMNPGGKIVFYGATNGLPNKIDLYRMFWNQLTLQGTTMGSDKEFFDMIKFVEKHKIHPVIDSVRPFNKILSAFKDIQGSKSFGKLVVKFD